MKIFVKNTFAFSLLFSFLFFIKPEIQASPIQENNAFRMISLTTAKELAAKEGKMIFLEFYASWCVPCKWMEETTLADHRVQESLKNNYIAIKVDIDDFDGYAIKELYQVKTLPTIMIVDEKGLTIERKEQSMTAEMLLDLLISKQGTGIKAPVNTSPSGMAKANKSDEQIINISSINQTDKKEAIVKTSSYRVQVGVFTDYANTQKLVEKLHEMTSEPVVILNDQLNDKLVYKVLLGDFEVRQNAEKLKNHLYQNYGIDSYVK